MELKGGYFGVGWMLRGRQLRDNLIPLISQAKPDPGSEFTLNKTC